MFFDGAWFDWSPVLHGVTTNPGLGNGVVRGQWTRLGRLVVGNLRYQFGSTSTFGAGTYTFKPPVVPVAPASGESISVGSGIFYQDSGQALFTVTLALLEPVKSGLEAAMIVTGEPFAGPADPFTWAANDVMSLDFAYQCVAD